MKRICLALALVLVLNTVVFAAESTKIRFGILPVLDTLPLQVAIHEGLFKKNGLDVELVPFNSALERDVAMQAGQLDGCFGDMVSAHLLIQRGVKTKIALVSYHTTPNRAMFGIVTSPRSSSRSVAALQGKTIGISKSTIIEYLLDRLEATGAVPAGYLERIEVKKFPVRLQMLSAGKLDSALLPEPLLSLMAFKGGKSVVTDENLDMPLTILCLNKFAYADSGAVYKSFIKAYAEAVALINKKPVAWKALMAKTCRITGPLVKDFRVYTYPDPKLPTLNDVRMVQEWMIGKGILKKDIPFQSVVSDIDPQSVK